jgi:molybdenum cofactor cytidylyltransferase
MPVLPLQRTAAIILAAGYSSRMGTLKPILKIGKQTILKGVISLFHESGIEDVIVIVGHRGNELVPEIVNCGARPVTNEHYERGMFSSVQVGVKALRP